jgi:hypothetical protein
MYSYYEHKIKRCRYKRIYGVSDIFIGVNLYTCERMDMGIYMCVYVRYMYKCLGKRRKEEIVWEREGNVTVREVM